MTGFIPYTKIIGLGLSNIGAAFNKDEIEENAPGGVWGGILTGGMNKEYMSTEQRKNYDRNWLEQLGDSARGTGPEVKQERAMGDLFQGEDLNWNAYGQQNVNRGEDRSNTAQFIGGLLNYVPWGSFGGG